MLIDSHAHLYADAFKEDIHEVISRAKEVGVAKIILPNIDTDSIDDMMDLSSRFPGYCFPTIGLHPCSVKGDFPLILKNMEQFLTATNLVGIGETGIDLYWDKTTLDIQQQAFRIQIDWAKQTNLPVIIHSRDSLDLTIEEIAKAQDGRLSGIFHCFTGNLEQLKRIRDLGFSMGLGGVVTFKNGGLDKILPESGLENMVLETDAPYLAPKPYRGKRNEPAYLKNIVNRISELTNNNPSQVIHETGLNSLKVFGKRIAKSNI